MRTASWCSFRIPPSSVARISGSHSGDFSVALQITAIHEKEDASVRHFLRSRARRIVLNTVKASCFDVEGIGEVDREIYSQTAWIKFRKSLSSEDQKILTIWRSGVVWTPTQRFYRPGSDQMDVRTSCKWCQSPQASARHFFAECPRFDDQRISRS